MEGETFDVFLCCQEEDESGERTEDRALAEELYRQLTKEGFRVFLSWITLEGISGGFYASSLSATLNSARVMAVLGTKPDFFGAEHVRNQWSHYLDLIKKDGEKILVPAYRDMSLEDIPKEFSHLRALDMSGFGFMLDMIREIRKTTAEAATAEAIVIKPAEKTEVFQENRQENPVETERIEKLIKLTKRHRENG